MDDKMSEFRPYFGAFWGPRALTFGEFKTQMREFLEGLQTLDPIFKTWYVLGDRMNDENTLGAHLEHLDELTLERGWDTEAPKDRFTYLDATERPTVNSRCRLGWGFGLVTELEAQRTSHFVHASIHVGGVAPRIPNRVLLKVDNLESPLLDSVMSEKVFRYMVEFWSPERAFITEQQYRDAVRDPETREQLGWLNYRADASFADCLPADVERKPFNGGVLFRIGDGRVLDENDTAETQLGRQIQEAVLGSK
ncbi:hypothetical protein J2Y69_000414 [Microbacterium resistens]|uniref:Immunity protein 52 domain-containing protein n=1 Tax=Microbacterium resistens TaxID=156977 RepID=A0ABU1S892_9MICO|nr:Imm52 family immunity protein [Microbacterium resistens]MDR6865832.1 hypothetical protein [Microbacterium resistens]